MKKILFLFLLLIIGAQAFAIDENISKQKLYLSDCIKLAIERSPYVKKARLNVKAAQKDIGIVKSNYAPAFSTSVGYWQGFNTNPNYDDGYTKRFLPTVGVYLDQLIFDFGKTSAKLDMQKLYKIAAQYAYFDALSKTADDVKVKYFAVLEAKSIVEIETSNLNISQKILDTTERLYKENKKGEIDYINSQVYLSSAKMNLITAENNYKQAMYDLTNALYSAGEPDFEIVNIDTFDYYEAYFAPEFLMAPKGSWHELTNRERQQDAIGEVQDLPFTLEYAQESAFKNNLEFKILNATLDAMKKSALAVKRQYYPDLKAKVGYEYGSKYMKSVDDTYRNSQLNVTLNASTGINPVKYANELAKINLQVEMAQNDVELYRQNMYFEVKKRYSDVETAQKQIRTAKDRVFIAKQNLDIASKDYLADKIGYIEFQSARQNYNTSKVQYINELKNYNISLSNLQRVTHIFEDNFIKLLYGGLNFKEKELLNL